MKATAQLDNFLVSELQGLDPKIKVQLQAVRNLAGVPIHVTSGYRRDDPGAHGDRQAVDISDNSLGAPLAAQWRYRVLRACFMVGFRRIGVYDRHIHIDTSSRLPQDVCWWATSD